MKNNFCKTMDGSMSSRYCNWDAIGGANGRRPTDTNVHCSTCQLDDTIPQMLVIALPAPQNIRYALRYLLAVLIIYVFSRTKAINMRDMPINCYHSGIM